jgi:GDPmannose 4,6-dehydratase
MHWGHARDYVHAQWLMLQQPVPEDFVIASGEQYSVREFAEAAARHLKMRIEWRGDGTDEIGLDMRSGRVVVRVDPRYFRPTEADTLLGDASKARRVLGWTPTVSFEELVAEMVAADVELARRDALVARAGFRAVQGHE